MGFEPMTSALPRMRSTTELQRPEIYPDYCPACCPDIPAALPGPMHRKAMTAPQANPAWEGLFPLRPHRSTTPSRNPPNYPPPTTPLPLPTLPRGLSLLLPPLSDPPTPHSPPHASAPPSRSTGRQHSASPPHNPSPHAAPPPSTPSIPPPSASASTAPHARPPHPRPA